MNMRVRPRPQLARLAQRLGDDLQAAPRLTPASLSQEPSGQIGAVPDTVTRSRCAPRG